MSDPIENLKPARFKPRYRLWMLFLLFIPAAIYANRLGQTPSLAYMESRSLLFGDEHQEILFSKLPDGTSTTRSMNINSSYQSLGVSFSVETPERLEQMKTPQASLAKTQIKTLSGELIDSDFVPAPPERDSTDFHRSAASEPSETADQFVGISGYPLRIKPKSPRSQSISSFIKQKNGYYKRFDGPITIRFHQPNLPNSNASVYRVGFFASNLNTTESLWVKLYTPNGRLIGSQSNIATKCVFMGFESKYPIGWLEVDTNEDYAIANLVFDEVVPHPNE